MEDEHPYILTFFVGIIAAAVIWVAFAVVEVVLVDYILMPGCNGTLWLANESGLTSWSPALMASIRDTIVESLKAIKGVEPNGKCN